MKIHLESKRLSALAVGLICTGVGARSAQAFGVWSQSLMAVSQNIPGSQLGILDFVSNGNNAVSATSTNRSFTGLDGNNVQQTMNFTGSNWAQSDFGRLRCYASGTVTNTYNNPSNPVYYDTPTNTFNPNGSPDTLVSLGFAGFNDTLHFGGVLQAGYKARYIFHVDGANTGYGAVADMVFGIQGFNDESFFAFDPGSYNTNWVTQTYDVNGITPQDVRVQFSNQFVVDTFNVADGSTLSGTSDFSSTLTLAAIEMLDANGNQASGWSVTSDSGTVYNGIGAVPEPGSIAVLSIGMFSLLMRRRSRK